MDLRELILIFPIVIFALSIHEFAHALSAHLLGDDTAKYSGRLTLDPLAHIDPIGTLAMLVAMINGIGFGWAKPVPINFNNFKNRGLGVAITGAAGPLSNILVAFLFTIPYRLNLEVPFIFQKVIYYVFSVNLGLAAFNLLPIPPLDGSRIIYPFMKGRLLDLYYILELYGQILLLLLIVTKAAYILLVPIYSFLLSVITIGM